MSDKYPAPSYAATIWTAGDQIWLSFPSPEEGARGHSVSFPNTEKGLHVALETLKERERQPKWLTIGNRGAPTKREIEEQLKNASNYNTWLRAIEVDKDEKARAEQWLKEIGL